MSYDDNNIFAKILRGEIPCKKIYEDEYVLSFHDVNPQKKIHVLIIPKGEYVNLDDFTSSASENEILPELIFSLISNILLRAILSSSLADFSSTAIRI